MKKVPVNFYQDQVDSQELVNVINGYFGRGEQSLYYNEFFREAEPTKRIRIEMDHQKGCITDIYALGGLEDTEIALLKERVKKELIDDQAIKIAQFVCFSGFNLEGAFRYKDLFQILPAPKNAPRIPWEWGRNHLSYKLNTKVAKIRRLIRHAVTAKH